MKEKKEKFSSFTQAIKFIMGIISWTVFVILVLIALFLIYYFISSKIYAKNGEEYRPPITLYTILTESMEPNINRNDVIVDLTIKNPEDIKIGDVITFVSTSSLTKGMVITHRVINIKQDENGYSYQTKGDANLSPDTAYVPFANVNGKVLFRIPKLGLLQSFLATKGGWLIIVVIPALFVIISDLLKIFRLTTAKNKIDDINEKEEKAKKNITKKKETIEKNLQRRYSIIRKSSEPDPIPHKQYRHVSNIKNIKKINHKKVTKMDLPKRIELPKLKKK